MTTRVERKIKDPFSPFFSNLVLIVPVALTALVPICYQFQHTVNKTINLWTKLRTPFMVTLDVSASNSPLPGIYYSWFGVFWVIKIHVQVAHPRFDNQQTKVMGNKIIVWIQL